MHEQRSYIGVTGFVERAQVEQALASTPDNSSRLLMVGVLASRKSLQRIPISPKWRAQYPDHLEIGDIFCESKKALNLVHYSNQVIESPS